MGAEIQWVPWNPKIGDVKPALYQYKATADIENKWHDGADPLGRVTKADYENHDYRIAAAFVPLDIDLPYLIKKSAACSPSTHAAILGLKAKFADEVCNLIDADRASRLSLAPPVNEKVDT
jgi:hypothetical protein